MDPLSIAATVASITGACLKTAMLLDHLRSKYQHASLTISSLCSECTLITASLTEVQTYLLRSPNMQTRPELRTTFDMALTGCMVVFSCLDQEVEKLSEAGPSRLTWRSKTKFLWNEDTMKEYLTQIRGQQAALSFLIQLLQMQSIDEIHQQLMGNKLMLQRQSTITQSLRSAHPRINVPESISGTSEDAQSINDDVSTIFTAAEFEFDDTVINSKAYRRALAAARAASSSSQAGGINVNVNELDAITSTSSAKLDGERATEKGEDRPGSQPNEPAINFDLIDFNTDTDEVPHERIKQSSLENLWGDIDFVLQPTLLDKTLGVTFDSTSGVEVHGQKSLEATAEHAWGIELSAALDQIPITPHAIPNTVQSSPLPKTTIAVRSTDVGTKPFGKVFSYDNAWRGLPMKVIPAKLNFLSASQEEQRHHVVLHNPNSRQVVFSIKTTAPKRFFVKPNGGYIDPGGAVHVEIGCNSIKYVPAATTRSDKFLVLSRYVRDEGSGNLHIEFNTVTCAAANITAEYDMGEVASDGWSMVNMIKSEV